MCFVCVAVMLFPPWSASMLLILLLYWTTSAQSHDPTCSNLSPSCRADRDLCSHTREQLAASSWEVKVSLNVIIDVLRKIHTKTASAVMKGLDDFAGLSPGTRGLVSHFINLALASVPQEIPLKMLKADFAEMNEELDSVSIQISIKQMSNCSTTPESTLTMTMPGRSSLSGNLNNPLKTRYKSED